MCPYIHIILPSYGVLAFIGITVVLIVVFYKIDKYEVAFKDFLQMFVLCVIGGILGSKALFLVSVFPELLYIFSIRNLLQIILQGGFVFYGGLFGVLGTIWVYTRRTKKYEAKQIYEMIAPSIPLFHTFGRIGCFMAGCCYGIKLERPVVVFQVVRFNAFPNQLFEAVFEFLLFIVLFCLQKKEWSGGLLRTYLISYAAFRFFIEFFRGDIQRGIFFHLSIAQWISLIIILYYFLGHNRKKRQHTIGSFG